jgi:hypothetical protein
MRSLVISEGERPQEPRRLFREPSVLHDPHERSTPTIRKGIRPGLTIVRDESPNGHGLHRPRKDADRNVVDTGPSAEQDHSVLCVELGRHLCHD